MTGPKRPDGAQLRFRNRRILSGRLRWPAGALEACERIERENPGWAVTYLTANPFPGFERPACYWAVRHLPGDRRHEVYAPDPEALVAEIDSTPRSRSWSLRSVIDRR